MRATFPAALAALTLMSSSASAAPPPAGGTAFEPAPRSEAVYSVAAPTAETKHIVPAKDGKDLYVETYLPEQTAGGPAVPERVPIVLISTPYDTLYTAFSPDSLESGQEETRYYAAVRHLVQRGYGVAINHVRGTGNSGGCLEQTAENQIDDTARVIDFLGTKAAYSDGSVGMYGVSYDAETQVSVAGLGDPELIAPLKAIIPIASVGGQYEYSNYDGVPFTGQALGSNGVYFPISAAPGVASPAQQRPHEKLDCQPELFTGSLDMSGDMTPFWLRREYRPGVAEVRAATLFVHGLRDFNVLPQTIRGWFDELPATTPHTGVLGVWAHSEPSGGRVESDWRRADWLAMVTAWYDRYLKGLDTGVEQWPAVQVQDSTGRWRAEPEFALGAGPAGQLSLNGDGTLGAAGPIGTTVFEEDGNGVSFTTGALPAPLSVSGQPVLDLRLISSEPDAHLTARLEVLRSDGRPLTHSNGTPAASYGLRSLRHLDPIVDGWFNQQQGRPAAAGTPIRVPIRFLPTDLVVPRGGRLRVTIAGTTTRPRDSLPSGADSEITLLHDCEGASVLRFLHADPDAPQLNVREPAEGTDPLESAPATIGLQDAGGLSTARVCGTGPSHPDAALTG